MKMPEILIIDDDTTINDMLNEVLRGEGYSVSQAFSGTEALILLKDRSPDLILLDLMLPGITGEQLLPVISSTPVIVISAKADTADKVELLLAGAVDYMTKPFDINELLARIKVQLRNRPACADRNVLSFGGIDLHTDSQTVYFGESLIRLTRTEFAILKLLMMNPEKVVAKLTILDRISNDTPDCTEDSLKIHIHNLRKKIKSAAGRDYISAVWGIGFMLTEKAG